eukprot:jgi/Mesen1/6272/ME000324S05310
MGVKGGPSQSADLEAGTTSRSDPLAGVTNSYPQYGESGHASQGAPAQGVPALGVPATAHQRQGYAQGQQGQGYGQGQPGQGYGQGQQPPPQPPVGIPYAGEATPIPGVHQKPAKVPRQPGQVIVGYEMVEPEVGCCKCNDLNTAGVVALATLIVIGVPCFAFIPCCMPECHYKSQRPIYGYPRSAEARPQQPMPVGVPPPGY